MQLEIDFCQPPAEAPPPPQDDNPTRLMLQPPRTGEDDPLRADSKIDSIATDLYINGTTDAATGASPSSKDEAYLSGYLAGMKAMILDGSYTLQIRCLSQAYTRGAYDGVEF